MIDIGFGVQMFSRSETGLRPPTSRVRFSPDTVTLHHEGPAMGAFQHASCATKWRGIQAYHMDSKGWTDIAYNYGICPHGFVYELRGWEYKSGANGTTTGNTRGLAVCYLGGTGDPFTDAAKLAFVVVKSFVDAKTGTPLVNGHRDWKPTECPGEDRYAWLKAGMPIAQPPTVPVVTPPVTNHDLARDLDMNPLRNGRGVLLDCWGGLHPIGGQRVGAGTFYQAGWDIACAVSVTNWTEGHGYVLDRWGGLHRFGNALPLASQPPYWSGWDIARDIDLWEQDGKTVGYLLDAYGGCHRIGSVPALNAPYFNW